MHDLYVSDSLRRGSRWSRAPGLPCLIRHVAQSDYGRDRGPGKNESFEPFRAVRSQRRRHGESSGGGAIENRIKKCIHQDVLRAEAEFGNESLNTLPSLTHKNAAYG